MPAPAHVAIATALALTLVGAGASYAQPTTAVEGHTTYARLVELTVVDGTDRPVLTGTMPCDPGWHEELVAAYLGDSPCERDRYAYAYPRSSTAPWEADVRSVNDSTFVDEQGSVWHNAEIVYREASQAPEGGDELVRAMASEVPPSEDVKRGDHDYALQLNEDLLEEGQENLVVGFGPEPGQLRPS